MNRHLKAWLAISAFSLVMAAVYALLVWNGPLVVGALCVVWLVYAGYVVTAK